MSQSLVLLPGLLNTPVLWQHQCDTLADLAQITVGAMVAAGALVTPGKRVRAGELWAGVPARHVRDIGEAERTIMEFTAPHYAELAGEYLEAQPAAAPRPAMGGGGP